MPDTSLYPPPGRVAEQAAWWFMRTQDADFGAAEQARLDHWLAQADAHQREYRAIVQVWAVSAALPPLAPAALPDRLPLPTPRHRWRPALALLCALVASVWLGWAAGYVPTGYQRYTSHGAVRAIVLPDGSAVTLNLNSRLSWWAFRDHRQVDLKRGEAWFEVQHNSAWPFVVRAGDGDIRVTGTRFNVWTWQDQVQVALESGAVQVRGARHNGLAPLLLHPGEQARFSASAPQPQVSPANLAQVLAWREGKLILDNLSLADALPQLNRYLATPVYLGDRATGQLRVGGIYNTSQVSQLVQALPMVLPVALLRNGDGDTVIQRQ